MTRLPSPTGGRSIPEWIGKTPDAKVPPLVQLRIFERNNGRCHISGVQIQPGDEWDVEHVQPLSMGGENRESNMKPALRKRHREKTAREAHQRAKERRVRSKHLGIDKPRSRPIPGSKRSGWRKPMNGKAERR